MKTVKCANRATLINLAKRADREGLNRQLITEDLEASLDPDGTNIVWMHGPVQDDPPLVRCAWMMKFTDQEEPVEGELDVHMDQFNALPEMQVTG
jgi:hypothetical protein